MNRVNSRNDLCRDDSTVNIVPCRPIVIVIIFFIFRVGKNQKIKKNTKKSEVEKLVRVVPRGKTVVQQYGVKTLNGNRNALK